MQRVVILFVGILSVVRATPFGLDSGDRPTPFRYTFRVEKVEFGNDAVSEYSGPEGYYEIGPDEDYYVNEPYESTSEMNLQTVLGDLELCDVDNDEKSDIPEEGCVYISNGNVHFLRVLSRVDVDDVYKTLESNGLEECSELVEVREGGCFVINEATESIHLLGVYEEELTDEFDELTDELKAQIGDIELCDESGPPEGGCVLLTDNSVGLINVLNEESIADVIKEMGGLDWIKECVFDDDHQMISADQCYWIDEETNSITFENVDINGTDDDDDYNYDYTYDYSQEDNEIPDEEITKSPSVQPSSLSGVFQRLNLKDLPNRRSSVAKKAKAALVKKVLSGRQSQSTQEKRRRRAQRSGRKDNNGGRANHLPKWMKHLKTSA